MARFFAITVGVSQDSRRDGHMIGSSPETVTRLLGDLKKRTSSAWTDRLWLSAIERHWKHWQHSENAAAIDGQLLLWHLPLRDTLLKAELEVSSQRGVTSCVGVEGIVQCVFSVALMLVSARSNRLVGALRRGKRSSFSVPGPGMSGELNVDAEQLQAAASLGLSSLLQ